MSWRYLTPTEMRALARRPALSNSVETSDAAARAVEPKRTKMQIVVMEAIARNGGDATADEIQVLTGLSGDSVRPRLIELCAVNALEKTDRKRQTRMGNDAFVYKMQNPSSSEADGGR